MNKSNISDLFPHITINKEVNHGGQAGFWNFFEVHIPLIVSGNIESLSGTFKNRIRIVLNLDAFIRYKLTR